MPGTFPGILSYAVNRYTKHPYAGISNETNGGESMSRVSGQRPASIVNPAPYPEIFFRLQPDISAACDEWESNGIRRPTQGAFDHMVERIHDNVCLRYPDLARQAEEFDRNNAAFPYNTPESSAIRVQQRGFFRGLIAFLLLRELLRRRRRHY
jgi:hypothetical protein